MSSSSLPSAAEQPVCCQVLWTCLSPMFGPASGGGGGATGNGAAGISGDVVVSVIVNSTTATGATGNDGPSSRAAFARYIGLDLQLPHYTQVNTLSVLCLVVVLPDRCVAFPFVAVDRAQRTR